mmetsp:Transcript_4903/g.10650  ORF Transcript_4903/g.10650 Transcript_4903/m.10650 type:complete len:400 (+) Transcript_4903:311-1510(+)|eukprot:4836387-Pleurochrysis_carterae.AAC.2
MVTIRIHAHGLTPILHGAVCSSALFLTLFASCAADSPAEGNDATTGLAELSSQFNRSARSLGHKEMRELQNAIKHDPELIANMTPRIGEIVNSTPTLEQIRELEASLAFVYIVTGSEATTEVYLSLSLRNLRTLGAWRGEVFVITDRVECIPALATAVKAPTTPHGLDNLGKARYSKQFKQKLLELVPLTPAHQYVFYIDMDVMVGKPVFNFLLEAIKQAKAKRAGISLFREGTGENGQADHAHKIDQVLHQVAGKVNAEYFPQSKKLPEKAQTEVLKKGVSIFHGGMFLVSRSNASRKCLNRWGAWYDSGEDRDQPSLSSAILSGSCKMSLLPFREHFGQPTGENIGTYWTFNHFTRTSRMKGYDAAGWRPVAGQKLLGLSPEVSQIWWKLKSPLCPV